MATLYQLHSTLDTLDSNIEAVARTWRAGDSIVLLGASVAYIAWLDAYLDEHEIQGVRAIYALEDDVAQLNKQTIAQLNLNAKLSATLSDDDWVRLTQDTQFNNVVTIAL